MDGNFEAKQWNLGTTRLREATSLLRQQIESPTVRVVPDDRGRMLAWQVRMVRDYIDSHIARRVLIADLCALVQRSDAHFSRSFKRTFGASPHVAPVPPTISSHRSFTIRRRVLDTPTI